MSPRQHLRVGKRSDRGDGIVSLNGVHLERVNAIKYLVPHLNDVARSGALVDDTLLPMAARETAENFFGYCTPTRHQLDIHTCQGLQQLTYGGPTRSLPDIMAGHDAPKDAHSSENPAESSSRSSQEDEEYRQCRNIPQRPFPTSLKAGGMSPGPFGALVSSQSEAISNCPNPFSSPLLSYL